jgi:hypothetical protein
MGGDPHYRGRWLSKMVASLQPHGPETHLLLLAGLPLLDGVFFGGLQSGALATPTAAAGFGLSVFSGAGCLAAASALEGSPLRRASSVIRIYGLVLAGALSGLLVLPLLAPLLLPSFHLVAVLILFGVAREIWPMHRAPLHCEPVEGIRARWKWGLQAALLPQVALAGGLLLSILSTVNGVLTGTLNWDASRCADGSLAGTAFAVLVAAAATLVGTLLLAVAQRVSANDLCRGGAAALLLIATSALGAPLPTWLPLTALPGALLLGASGRKLRHCPSFSRGARFWGQGRGFSGWLQLLQGKRVAGGEPAELHGKRSTVRVFQSSWQ